MLWHALPEMQMHVGCKTDKPLTTKHAVACFRQLVPERPDLVLIELGSQEFAAAGISKTRMQLMLMLLLLTC
jgi:hypothetical protein